jgi:hypothetical protein
MIPWQPYLRLAGGNATPASRGDGIARGVYRLVLLVERIAARAPRRR